MAPGLQFNSLFPEMKSLSRISLKSLSMISFSGKYQVSSSPGRHLTPLLTHFVGKSLIRRPAPARFNFSFFKSLSATTQGSTFTSCSLVNWDFLDFHDQLKIHFIWIFDSLHFHVFDFRHRQLVTLHVCPQIAPWHCKH